MVCSHNFQLYCSLNFQVNFRELGLLFFFFQKTSPETCDDKISELLQKRFAKSHTSPNLEIVGSVCPFMEALKKILEMKVKE